VAEVGEGVECCTNQGHRQGPRMGMCMRVAYAYDCCSVAAACAVTLLCRDCVTRAAASGRFRQPSGVAKQDNFGQLGNMVGNNDSSSNVIDSC
jgi:hypothetical protein